MRGRRKLLDPRQRHRGLQMELSKELDPFPAPLGKAEEQGCSSPSPSHSHGFRVTGTWDKPQLLHPNLLAV